MSANSLALAQCTEYSLESFGGTEALVAALIRGLSPRCKIVLVSNDQSEAIGRSEFSSLIAAHVRWQPDKASPETAQDLARQLRGYDVDLAHFHFGGNYRWGNRALNRCALLDVNRAGIPCVSTNHGAFALLDGYCASWRPTWLKLALLPAAWVSKMHVLSHLETEIAVSQHDLRNLQAWYWPLRGKFRQIYHSKIQRDEQSSNALSRNKTILCIGSIGFRKGQTVLAEAFEKIAARHPEWNLIMAGRPAEVSLVARIEEIRMRSHLQDRIRLVENLSDNAVAELMRTSEIFAMPSLHEGLGLSLQEALFRGCACVGSRVGGIPELIEDGENGLLVRPGNAEELSAALERLIDDAALRERLRSVARSSILEKGMIVDKMVQAYERLYSEILSDQT
jgi:glycosyltransferase involved in cell wall biosynthesis